MAEATQPKPAAKRLRKMTRTPKPALAASGTPLNAVAADSADTSFKPTKPPSKSAKVLEQLRRPEGATIDQLIEATGWLPHTTRAVLTSFKKKGYILASEKPTEGARIYRVTGMAEVK